MMVVEVCNSPKESPDPLTTHYALDRVMMVVEVCNSPKESPDPLMTHYASDRVMIPIEVQLTKGNTRPRTAMCVLALSHPVNRHAIFGHFNKLVQRAALQEAVCQDHNQRTVKKVPL